MPSPPESRSPGLISVVLSFRNEEAVLPELIRRLTAVLTAEPEDHELIFVNDDSTDRSLDILREHAAADPHIKVITMSRRFGVFECVLAGMERAGGDAVVYMDTDLQDPPEVVPEMLGKWRDGAEVVYTIRSRRANENPAKMWLTRQAYRVIAALSEVDQPVNAGDFRLLGRRARDHLLAFRESDPYLRGLTRWIGFRQEPVYYERGGRAAGQGHFPVLRSLNPARTFINGLTSFSVVPVFAILIFGLVASMLALAGLAGLGIAGLLGATVGAAAWVVFLLFLWASMLAAVGTVGIYVTRIFKDVRARPRFIVAETINLGD